MSKTLVLDGWHSGQVVRKHTMMNLRPENIAEHTWGVLHVLLSVFTEVPTQLLIKCLYHDFGERATGDIPGPVKWANPVIANHCEEMEQKYIRDNLVPQLSQIMGNGINEREKYILEFCDRIEFCFSMYREIMMGNKYGWKPFYRSKLKAEAAWENLKAIDINAAEDIHKWWPEMAAIEAEMKAA